jgi:peptidoglycan/LPS O-acetylase OafA/YrhL
VGVEFLAAFRGYGERRSKRRREKEPTMSTVTVSPDTTAKHVPSRLTRTLPRATASSGVLAAAGTTAGAAVLRAAGVPLAAHGKIPLAAFAQLTFVAAVLGGVLLAVLIRRNAAPRQRFVQITAGLTAVSCAAPLAVADTTASKAGLVVLHVLAAAIIVPMLARHADRGRQP